MLHHMIEVTHFYWLLRLKLHPILLQLDSDLLTALYEFYKDDFLMFDYSPHPLVLEVGREREERMLN